jgi:hypothetical protein
MRCFVHAVRRIYCIEPSCSLLTTLQLTNCLHLKYCIIYRQYERNPQLGNAFWALRPFTIVEVEELQRIPRKEHRFQKRTRACGRRSQFSEKEIGCLNCLCNIVSKISLYCHTADWDTPYVRRYCWGIDSLRSLA